jgi:MFS family permease
MAMTLGLLGLTLELGGGSSGSRLSLLCLVAYIVAFALGTGPVVGLLIAEIFPPETRAVGAGVATSAIWFCTFVVGLMFLPVAAAIGQGPTFWIFAAVYAAGCVFVSRYVPETKGRTFVEIDAELRGRRSPSGHAP